MLIPKSLILEAKEKLGEQAALIIAKDLEIKEFSEEKLKGICPFHHEETGSFIWNPKDNAFKCFGCGRVYGILDHYIEYYRLTYLDAVEKLFKESNIRFRFGEKGVKVNREHRYPHPEQIENISAVASYWEKRKISEATLRYAGIGQDEHGNTVFHYYDTNDVLCNVKYRPSRKVEKHEKLPKFWIQHETDTMPLLYGMNLIDPTQTLVICEGESDYLSILEAGWKNVVSVPFGAGYKKTANIEKEMFTWIETNYEWLEQFERIIVWFDNDEVGVKGRKEACSRLGTWRTYFVDVPLQLPDNNGELHNTKDANEVLYHCGKQKILDLINDAKEMPVPNVINLADAEDFDIETAPGLYSGLKDINDIVYKFIYGSVVILTGRKGHGKSTLLNQVFICEALNQSEDVFIFSGELSNSVLKNWIETTMIGKEFIKMKNKFARVFDKDALKSMREWYDSRIWSYDSIDNTADAVLDKAINITRRYGAKVWILDNLMTLDIGITGDSNQWLKQKEFIVKLVALAKTYGVLIVLVSHPRKMGGLEIDRRLGADDVAGSGDLGNLVQYIVSTHRFSKREKEGEKDQRSGGYKRGKEPILEDVAVDILKNRYTGKLGGANFFFDYSSYRFYSKPEELSKRYNWYKGDKPLPVYKLPESIIPDNMKD